MSSFVSCAKDFYGKLSATGFIDGAITLTASGKKVNLFLHTEPICGLCFGQINRKPVLAAAGYDGILSIWSPINGKWEVIQEIKENQPILSVSISTQGNVAAVLKGGKLQFYRFEDGKLNPKEAISGKDVTSCTYLFGTEDIVYGTKSGKVCFTKVGKNPVTVSQTKVISVAACDYGVAAVTDDSKINVLIDNMVQPIPTTKNSKPVSCAFTPITCQLEIVFEDSSSEMWSYSCDRSWAKVPVII